MSLLMYVPAGRHYFVVDLPFADTEQAQVTVSLDTGVSRLTLSAAPTQTQRPPGTLA